MAIFINSYFVKPLDPLLLDLYPGAILAVSTRKLRLDYNGPCIRVRRTSDNVEQDIGFVGENLDTSALLSFCAGTSGRVAVWYDQSGNNHNFFNTMATQQPEIVNSGIINNENGKPVLELSSVDKRSLRYLSPIKNTASDYFISLVERRDSLSPQFMFSSSNPNLIINFPNRAWFTDTLIATAGIVATNLGNFSSVVLNLRNGNGYARKNGTTLLSSQPYTQTPINVLGGSTFMHIGASASGGGNWIDGAISEFIIWDTDQDINLNNIENNINTYYTIY
jgi:hypothetical protein